MNTNVDTLAREAAQRARGDVAMVEVPEADAVIGRRRKQHRTRAVAIALVSVAVLGTGVAAAIAATGKDTKPPVAVKPAVPKATLEFRPVQAVMPWVGPGAPSTAANDGSCQAGALVTPSVQVTPEADGVVLADRKTEYCYRVGPRVLDGSGVADATAAIDDVRGAWYVEVTFANDDFVTKVADPFVNETIAIVVDGRVISAPKIGAGIVDNVIRIFGDFTEAEARELATRLGGGPDGARGGIRFADPRFQAEQEWCFDTGPVAADCEVPPDAPIMDAGDVRGVRAFERGNEWLVEVRVDPVVTQRFDPAKPARVFLMDGEISLVPDTVVGNVEGGVLVIDGNFDEAAARLVADAITQAADL